MTDVDLFTEAAAAVVGVLRPLSVEPGDVEQKLKLISAEIQKMDIDPAQQRTRRNARLKLYRNKIVALQKCIDVLEQASPPRLWDLERLLSNEIGDLISNEAFYQNGTPVFPRSGLRYYESFKRHRDPASVMASDSAEQTRLQRKDVARRHGGDIMLLVFRRLQAPLREQIANERARAPDGRPVDQRRRFVISEIWDIYRQLTGEGLSKVPPERFRRVCAVTVHLYGVDEQGLDKATDRLFAKAYQHWAKRESAGKT
jgi:hypothetical protein